MTSLVDLLTGDGDPASLDGYPDPPPITFEAPTLR